MRLFEALKRVIRDAFDIEALAGEGKFESVALDDFHDLQDDVLLGGEPLRPDRGATEAVDQNIDGGGAKEST